jgi:hypothetical protein
MREGVAAGLLPAAVSSPRPAAAVPSSSWRTALPWAVAATLALAVGYQSLWVVPGLRSEVVGSQALAPVTLRAASRGAEPIVVRPASGVVSFAIDANGIPAGAGLTYDLRAADGSSVASGTAVAPSPGIPLLLLVPASAFGAPGGHTLSVRPDRDPGTASVDYRFTLSEQ